MFFNYLLTTIRNIQKHPGHFVINVTGLSLGMAVFIFIFQFVGFEASYDNYHEGTQIYRITSQRYMHNELTYANATANPPLAPAIVDNIPEVEIATRVYNDGNCVISIDEIEGLRVFEESKAYYVDENFFEIFNFKIIEGTRESALTGTRKMALSETSAKKYFGSAAQALGKSLKVTGQVEIDYDVSAVYIDAPLNSHFKPDMLFSMITYLDVVHPDWPVRTNWIWNDFGTYMRAEGDPKTLELKINELAQRTWGEQYKSRDVNIVFQLQPIESIHTTSHLNGEYEKNTSEGALSLLVWISIITLIVAWINYINLATARSIERAKEVGVRKAIGARKSNLIWQFFTEAMVINLFSVTLSFGLLLVLKDVLQSWLGIVFPLAFDGGFLAAIMILIIGGILSSMYPAWIMSSFSLVSVLKGKLQTRAGGISLRKALVLIQFIVSPIMIGGTYLLYNQTEYLINRDMGITKDQILVVKAPRVQVGNMPDKLDRFKNKAEESSNVHTFSKISLLPGEATGWGSSFRLYGDSTVEQIMEVNLVEYDFEKALDIEPVAGRTYSRAFADSANFVINEAAARLWGYEPSEIIGRKFWWWFSPSIDHLDKTIIGVIKDYKQEPFTNKEIPMVYCLSRYTPAPFAEQFFTIRLKTSEGIGIQATRDEVSRTEELWKQTYPDDPFTYWFLDDAFEQNFQAETQLLKSINLFALISVLIAGMGLFGLTSFTVLQRTKEVGIRKALGATVPNIVQLLSKEYFILIILAYLISLPIMWFGSELWLQNYEIKMERTVTIFLVPLVGSLTIGILSVMYKSIVAAQRKPVETLRNE